MASNAGAAGAEVALRSSRWMGSALHGFSVREIDIKWHVSCVVCVDALDCTRTPLTTQCSYPDTPNSKNDRHACRGDITMGGEWADARMKRVREEGRTDRDRVTGNKTAWGAPKTTP